MDAKTKLLPLKLAIIWKSIKYPQKHPGITWFDRNIRLILLIFTGTLWPNDLMQCLRPSINLNNYAQMHI